MKTFLMTLLLSTSAIAGDIYCRSPDSGADLHLNLNQKEKTFNFAQFCWNPCHMGSGEITAGPIIGWAGIRYRLNLSNSEHMISPLTTSTMTLFLAHDLQTGTLSDRTATVTLECQRSEE